MPYHQSNQFTLPDPDYGAIFLLSDQNGYIYLGMNITPNRGVLKIRLSDYAIVDTLILSGSASSLHIYGGVMDVDGGYLYVGGHDTLSHEQRVWKVALSTFTEVDALDCTDQGILTDGHLDVTNNRLYFLLSDTQSHLMRIDLSTFTLLTTYTFDYYWVANENIAVDEAAGFIYIAATYDVGFGSSKQVIWKILLSNGTIVDTLEMPNYDTLDVYGIGQMFIDVANGWLYVQSSHRNTAHIFLFIRVKLSTFTIDDPANDIIEIGDWNDDLSGGDLTDGCVIDLARQKFFYTTNTGVTYGGKGHLFIIDLATFTKETDFLLEDAEMRPRASGLIDSTGCVYLSGDGTLVVEVCPYSTAATLPAWTEPEGDCPGINDPLYMDSSILYSGDVATDVVTGLDHLEGQTVGIKADGVYKGTQVVTDGQITLEETASIVEVGLLYTPTLKTMRPSFPQNPIEGVFRGWAKAYVRVYNSVGANINGEEVLFNLGGQAMDSGPAQFSGDKELSLRGMDKDGYMTITQDEPYPLVILALYGRLAVAGW